MKGRFKTLFIWGVLLAIVIAVMMKQEAEPMPISAETAMALMDEGEVYGFRSDESGYTLVTADGEYLVNDPAGLTSLTERLDESEVPYLIDDSDPVWDLVKWLLVLLVAVIALFYFLRRFGGGGQMNNIFELRKTKAREISDAEKAMFTDIGGNQEAVELLADIVDFLKSPDRWVAAGARIPRGVLLVGPPGTGKTLLARAVAGETNSKFLYTSASEFVELFVGIGAARVRDTFEKAAAQQPAVIFIDELDAVGRRRGSGIGTMHEEREQTLNQLLTLMDGLEQKGRIVVMAATNRPDVLDAALLRSGRFDRVLKLEPPTPEARLEILKIHTRRKKLASDVSLEKLAATTDGFNGADIEALTNQAALNAVRRTRGDGTENGPVVINSGDFDKARETMLKTNRRFDHVDNILVESVSQFAEPTGRAAARVTLSTGAVIEGDIQWMNSTHFKLRAKDGFEAIVAKESAVQIEALNGMGTLDELTPDAWAGKSIDVG
jgi:cell division protease FtsH